MGKSAGSAPTPPNPVTVANAQGTADVNTAAAQAALNNVNQVTPYGNLTYQQTGSTDINGNTVPQYTATTTLTPAQQQALTQQQQLTSGLYGLAGQQLGRVASNLSQPIDNSNLPAAPTDISAINTNAVNQVYGLATQNLDPQWAKSQSELNDQLAQQGIPTGSDAYNSSQEEFARSKSQAYAGAMQDAISQGQTVAQNNFADTEAAREQGLQENAYLYNQPLNEAIALEGGGQIQNPTFSNTPQTNVAPTDVTGAFGLSSQAAQNTFSANANAASAGNSATAGLAGAALGAGALVVF